MTQTRDEHFQMDPFKIKMDPFKLDPYQKLR